MHSLVGTEHCCPEWINSEFLESPATVATRRSVVDCIGVDEVTTMPESIDGAKESAAFPSFSL